MNVLIPVGEWLPDLPVLGNPGATVVKNALAMQNGYRPVNSLSALSNAIDARPIGAGAGTSSEGVTRIFVGNASKIYLLSNALFGDVSKSGGYTNSTDRWEFATYGNAMVATNFADYPQTFDMVNGGVFSDLTTAFKAKTVATVRDFVMFGNTWDASDGHKSNRVRWSAIGNHTDYTISATTQSDFQDTPGGGACQRIFGGEYATILFERSIVRVSYIGSPVVFQFDAVETGRGLLVQGAAAQTGGMIFFLDSDGFYVFDGQRSNAIGSERVDRWFFNDLDNTYIDRITCAVDPTNKLAIWSYPGSGHIGGKPNRLIIFNYELNRWSYADVLNDLIFPTLTTGYTVESIDVIAANIDSIDISLDSRALSGGNIILGAFNDLKFASFSGPELPATIETVEKQTIANRRASATEVWPLVDHGITTVRVGTRDRQSDGVTWGPATPENIYGFCPVRQEGRYHRIRLNIGGAWNSCLGVDIGICPGGRV